MRHDLFGALIARLIRSFRMGAQRRTQRAMVE